MIEKWTIFFLCTVCTPEERTGSFIVTPDSVVIFDTTWDLMGKSYLISFSDNAYQSALYLQSKDKRIKGIITIQGDNINMFIGKKAIRLKQLTHDHIFYNPEYYHLRDDWVEAGYHVKRKARLDYESYRTIKAGITQRDRQYRR